MSRVADQLSVLTHQRQASNGKQIISLNVFCTELDEKVAKASQVTTWEHYSRQGIIYA